MKKSAAIKYVELILCILFGYLGVHRFYAKKMKSGLIYLFTIGLFGLGWIYDIVVLSIQAFTSSKPSHLNEKHTLSLDGYHLAYHYDDVKFYSPNEMVSKIDKEILSPGVDIILKPEPKNKYDPRAIALYIGRYQIGYLLKGTLQDMVHDYMDKKWPIIANLSSIRLVNGEYEGRISLSFYRESQEIPPSAKRRGYQDIDIHSIHPTDPDAHPNTPLTGKDIVFCGYFDRPIDEMMQLAVDAGAILKSRVSKNTKYLVVGNQNPDFLDEDGKSSKEQTAAKLIEEGKANIQIISEYTFLKLVEQIEVLPF